MNIDQSPIVEFKRERDFGKIFNDTFRFMKLNMKSLFALLLLLPGPLYLIAGAYQGYMQASGLNTDPNSFLKNGLDGIWDFYGELFLSMMPYYILIRIGTLVGMAAVYRYLILYQEKRENNSIQISDITRYLLGDVWRLFYNNLLLGFIIFLLVLPIILIGMASVGLVVLLAVLLIIALLLVGPQFGYAVTSGFYLVIRDEILITTAFRKAWKYMNASGNFWWTWVIIFVSSLLVGVAAGIFGLPEAIVSGIGAVSSRMNGDEPSMTMVIISTIFGVIAMLGPLWLTPISYMFSVLAYHSYEETIEGSGLKDRIDEIKLDS